MAKQTVVIIVLDQIIEEIITGYRKYLNVLTWHRKKYIGIHGTQEPNMG